MATILTYARMCNAVYEDNPTISGWTQFGFRPSGTGLADAFQGVAFKKGAEVIVAFKGTSQKRDVIADLKLGIGINTSQYADAVAFLDKMVIQDGAKVTLTGHSLGGAIAQVVGNRRRLPFVTFNAPGVAVISKNLGEVATSPLGPMRAAGTLLSTFLHPIQAAQDLSSLFYSVRGVNLRLGQDIVGSVGVHYGKVIVVTYGGGSFDLLQKHKMTTFIESLAGTKYEAMELDALLS